jgi:hypothetical protein
MSENSGGHTLAHGPKHRDVNRLCAKRFFDGTKLPMVSHRPSDHYMLCISRFPAKIDRRSLTLFEANRLDIVTA